MFKIIELIRGCPELPEGSVMVPEPPSPEVLQATTSGVGVSKSPRKTTTFILEEKQKQEQQRTLGESGRKVNTRMHWNIY